MPHYQRNVRFIFFLILPILGFLLGWSLSQKTSENEKTPGIPVEASIEKPVDSVLKALQNQPQIFKKTKPKDVDLSEFWEVWGLVESNYLRVEDMKSQDQIYGAIKGLVESLGDPYTVFLTPEDFKEFNESMSGEFQGIGAEIDRREHKIIVVSPIKGSPAESAGLKTNDIIAEVNGKSAYDWSVDEAVTKLRGPKGEKVDLTIVREGEKKPLEISIVRDNIVLPTLEWAMKGKEEQIAVISIYQFGDNVVKDFRAAVQEILMKSPKGIVIDLRGNGGGLLDACVQIISDFIQNKVVVKTSGRKFGDSGDLLSGRDGSFLEMPLVVLVNGGSASASEIFAGAVQDHRRGVLIGEKTFGKGSVQNLIPLENGSGLKITVAEWLTPNGRSIHEKGITPDLIVEPKEGETDLVLEKALEIMGSPKMEEILKSKPSEQ